MNLRECKSFAKRRNLLDINLFSSSMFTGLIAETFLTIAYCVDKRSWNLNNISSTKVMHSLGNFRGFFSIETLESTCWVAALTSIKNSFIWLFGLLSQPSFIIFVNAFASSNFFFLKIYPSNRVKTMDMNVKPWYMNVKWACHFEITLETVSKYQQ